MSRFLIPLIFLFLFSCKEGDKQTAEVKPAPADSTNTETAITWIEDFRNFRTAVYKDDLKKIKNWFQFPVLDEGNDLWATVDDEKIDAGRFSSGTTVPITEKDFDKYHKEFLPSEFIQGILKIKTEELYKTGTYESPDFERGDIIYKMRADFDKEKNILLLNLSIIMLIKNERGGDAETNESSYVYSFKVLPNGRLQFTDMAIAG